MIPKLCFGNYDFEAGIQQPWVWNCWNDRMAGTISKLGFSNHEFETAGMLEWQVHELRWHSGIDFQNMNANEWETFDEHLCLYLFCEE